MAGHSAVATLTLANATSGARLTIPAASVPPEALLELPKAELALTDRFARFALMASANAVADAGLDWTAQDPSRCGVASGSCMNGITETEVGFEALFVRGRSRVHPFTLVRTMPNAPAACVAMRFELAGPTLHYSTTCSSSSVAIGEAARTIRHGYADVMIAGGTESLLTYSAVNCWNSAQLLARLHDDPAQSCRPFDSTRDGTVLGEGAVFVVLEDWDRALARGAPIRAELAGYACSADSGHLTQPSVAGQARIKLGPYAIIGPLGDVFIRRTLKIQPADAGRTHRQQGKAAIMVGIDQFFRGGRRFSQDAEPPERILPLILGEHS